MLLGEQEIIQRYDNVRHSAKNTRTEEWIAQWEATLRDAIELKIPDVQGIRPTRHFLQAISKINPLFSQTWLNTIETKAVMNPEANLEQEIPNGYQIAQIFRNQQRQSRESKSSFAATLQGESAPAGPRTSPKCPIHLHHPEEDCFTLHKDKRPQEWKWTKRTAQQTIAVLEKKPKLKEKFADTMTEATQFIKSTEQTSSEADQQPIGAATAQPITLSSFSNTIYPLRDSFILDSGSPAHICNDRERFQDFRPTAPEPVLSGDNITYITGYGQILIRVATAEGQRLFQLNDVAYISGFHTNVVSHKRLRQAGYSWNDHTNRIMKGSISVFSLEEMHNQYVIEFNPPKAAFSSSSAQRPPRDADAERWHLRCGHIGREALERLMTATYGVRIKGQLTLDCEACIQAAAKQKISRRPAIRVAPRPLWRIHFDLFQLPPSSVGYERALVIRDEYSGQIWMYALPNKTQEEVVSTIQAFAQMAKRQWNLEICIIRRDNEQSLGNRYKQWIQSEGIQEEPSPVYTPEPNGRAERSGGVLRQKALAMQLSANLPAELWPETWQAAAYLYNRSPRAANIWKSPLESFNNWLRDTGRDN
ncbi:hypothetical protein DV736_g6702, partial [Chaetothyriales sp. CBS 134916]